MSGLARRVCWCRRCREDHYEWLVQREIDDALARDGVVLERRRAEARLMFDCADVGLVNLDSWPVYLDTTCAVCEDWRCAGAQDHDARCDFLEEAAWL